VNPETPLPEVAHLLPAQQAATLGNLEPFIQEATLKDVRHLVVQWEQSGLDFDPITFEKALGPVVDVLAILNMALLSALEGKG
jgi:hypothetical protein